MTDQDLLTKFNTLPKDARDWLSSLEATYKIIDLNTRLNLRGARENVLADFIFRLVTRDLDPRDFMNALAIELKISDGAAKAITKLLEEQILHRIEASLRGVGIETQTLHFEGDEMLQPITKLEDVAPRDSEKLKVESKIVPPVASIQEPATSVGPVIIHAEKEETRPQEQAPRPIFSVKIPVNKKQYVAAPAPLAARVEVPAGREQVTGDREQERAMDTGKLKAESQKKEQQPATSVQPPMRALSDLHREQVTGDREQKNTAKPVSIIKSVAPKSMATPIHEGTGYRGQVTGDNGKQLAANAQPKIIPVVAQTLLMRPASPKTASRGRRVVHYSDWRTLI